MMFDANVRLRALEPEDLDVLYQIENDTTLWHVGNTNVPYSRYVLHDYVAHASGDIYTDKQVRMMIVDSNDDVVGIVDLINFDATNRKAEVGIVIMSKYRRMGYGVNALKLLSKYATEILHLHQLYAYVDCENIPSVELFDKAGYKPSLQLKDWLYDGKKYHNAMIMQFFF